MDHLRHLRHLPAFVQAAERGSFAAAGEALELTGSAVSKAVALLEQELGVPLFLRSTRGITLTGDGRRFLARCREALSLLDEAREHSHASRREVRGDLRVLMHPTVGRYRLAAALPELLDRHPQLRVQLVFYEGYPGLEAAGADVAVVLGELDFDAAQTGPTANLVALPLAHNPQWVCASPSYLLRRGEPLQPEELLQHRCITLVGPNRLSMSRWHMASDKRHCAVDVTPYIAFNDGPACRAAAVAGHGIVRLPQIVVEGLVARGELVRLMPDWYTAGSNFSLIFPANARRVPRVRVFIEFMQRLLADVSPERAPHLHGFTSPGIPLHRWRARDPLAGLTVPVHR